MLELQFSLQLTMICTDLYIGSLNRDKVANLKDHNKCSGLFLNRSGFTLMLTVVMLQDVFQ